MKCPACGKTLASFKYNDISLDFCESCDGVWFDPGELQDSIQHMISEGKVPDAKIELDKEVRGGFKISERSRACPRCRTGMGKLNYAYDSNVIVDKCESCGGIWTDSGELQKLAVFMKGNPVLNRLGDAIAKDSGDSLGRKYSSMDKDNSGARWALFPFMPRIILPLGDDTPCGRIPFVVFSIIAFNVAVFIYQTIFVSGNQLGAFFMQCGFVPATGLSSLSGAYTMFSSMFIHADIFHLAGNMLFLWIFADNIEDRFGHLPFFALYLFFGVFSDLAHALFNSSSAIPTVGASGAIAGTMGAYMALYPSARIKTIIYGCIHEVPAVAYLGFWIGMQLLGGFIMHKSGEAGGVAWLCHIGGFAAGIATGTLSRLFKKNDNHDFSKGGD